MSRETNLRHFQAKRAFIFSMGPLKAKNPVSQCIYNVSQCSFIGDIEEESLIWVTGDRPDFPQERGGVSLPPEVVAKDRDPIAGHSSSLTGLQCCRKLLPIMRFSIGDNHQQPGSLWSAPTGWTESFRPPGLLGQSLFLVPLVDSGSSLPSPLLPWFGNLPGTTHAQGSPHTVQVPPVSALGQ